MVGNRRQGWAIYAAMLAFMVALFGVAYAAEQHGSPAQHVAGEHPRAAAPRLQHGGQGAALRDRRSALWAAVTTDTSCGAVNAAHESLTAIGGVVPLADMKTGEVVFGGVGSGLYGMLLLVILACSSPA